MKTKKTICIPFLFLFLLVQTFAQNNVNIIQTITYHSIFEFSNADVFNSKMSADGSKVIFADYATKIYTINFDGTESKEIFNFEHRADPWLDISSDGSKVVFGNRGEFYIANSDGGQLVHINKLPNGNGGEFWLDIRLRPRITADGSEVYFCNTGGGEDMGGIWKISTDGSNPQQLISYTDIRNEYQLPYNQDWGNFLFHPEFDISDDGSVIIFATTIVPSDFTYKLMVLEGGNLSILFEPIASTHSGSSALSGDATKVVAIKPLDGSNAAICSFNLDGSNLLQLKHVSGLSSTQLQLTRDGSKVFINWNGTNGTCFLINTDGTNNGNLGIIQAFWLDQTLPFRGLNMSNISFDGQRINFACAEPIHNRLRKIWVAEIDPPSFGNAPVISNVTLTPLWLVSNGLSASTFSVHASGSIEPIEEVGYASFPEGLYRNVFGGSYTKLLDNGTLGDITAGDGIYTNNAVTTNMEEESDGIIPVRFSARTVNHVTSVDVSGLFVSVTDVEKTEELPSEFRLRQNYPNPFNPTTTIKYSIPTPHSQGEEVRESFFVSLTVYDILGREVANLVNQNQKPGYYDVNFGSSVLSSGIYFYKIKVGEFIDIKKMLLLR